MAAIASPGRLLTGQCVCGAVRYEVLDEFVYAANCHCSSCRRATGSAYKPFAGIERHKFRLTAGADQLLTLGEPDGHDARCAVCGGYLYSLVRSGEWVHVTFGSLTDTPTIRATEHIFAGSKADWETICDRLPQYVGHSDGERLA